MEELYQFLVDKMPGFLGFFQKALPFFFISDIGRYFFVFTVFCVAVFLAIVLVIGIFKLSFFRRLARILLVSEIVFFEGLFLIGFNVTEGGLDVLVDIVVGAQNTVIGPPLAKLFPFFGEKIVGSFVVLVVLFFVIWAIMHAVIIFSKRTTGRRRRY